ncbi:MAG: aminotransferase class IV family protein [Proteobacteria bacterium]|nr:aminotransferase class IV family protein [Pseudomonadota bacterium]
MDGAEARIDPTDRGLTLGDGLFETIAVRGATPARLDAHLARLREGARVIGLDVPLSDPALADALSEVVEANHMVEGSLRLTLTRGPAPRGLAPVDPAAPSLLIMGWPGDLPGDLSGDSTAPEPVTAIIATRTRRNEHSPLARIKSLNFLDGILAAREAAEKGADDALLLNTRGTLAEATAANLFLVIDGRAVTPPVDDGALPGVMRADVLRGLGAEENTLGPDDLAHASEAFLTNALGIRALVTVDGAPVGGGGPGPVTAEAQKIV